MTSRLFQRDLLSLDIGETREIKFKHVVRGNQSGFIGDATMHYEGSLIKLTNGGWSFTGNMYLRDVYNFEWNKKRSDERNIATKIGLVANGLGQKIEWYTPKIPVSFSSGKSTFSFPDLKGSYLPNDF